MIINRSFKEFKFRHRSKKNQIIYTSKKIQNDNEVTNLIDNFLVEKNSFIFESVEKGKIKGRYTIFGKDPDKIWEFNDQNSYLIKKNKRIKLKDKPEKLIEKIIEDFNNVFNQVDLILTPTAPSDAFVIGEKVDDPISMYLNDIFTVPSSLAGLPALSLPGGLSKNNRPLGLQLIANTFREDLLFTGAYALEKEINFNNEPLLGI